MAGWLFRDAVLEEGERIIFRRGANLRRGRRAIDGEVSVTDRRLLFLPNRPEQQRLLAGLDIPPRAVRGKGRGGDPATAAAAPPAGAARRRGAGSARPGGA